MRVLFAAHGSYGHVLPLVGVARALQDAGHELRFAVGEDLCSAVTSFGLRAVAAGMSDRAMVAEAHRRWPEIVHQSPANWAARMFTDIAAPAMSRDLAELIASWRPDLVVREEGEYGAPAAAAAAGVTCVTHGWGSPLPSHAELEGVLNRLVPLWRTYGLDPPEAGHLYGAAVLDPCPRSLYGDTSPIASAHAVRPATAELRGASDSSRAPPSRGPLAYVGFGTVPLYRDQPELLATVIEALLAAEFCVLATTPHPELRTRHQTLDPERVQFAEWVSLPRLLPQCELVVSHGGAGTALAALAAGIPLLLLPRGSPSQQRTSRACAARGVAHVLNSEQLDRVELEAAVTELTNDQRFRASARDVAREIAGMPPPEEAVRFLEALDHQPM